MTSILRPIVLITNAVINGLLLLRVVYALISRVIEESRVPSVKRKLVHVLLTCFCLFRCAWSVQECFGGNPRPLRFFFDTTAMCLFFTSFIIVFFHLLKKLSGWNLSKTTSFLVLGLVLNAGVYIFSLVITLDAAAQHQLSYSPLFSVASIVIASYSIFDAVGFLLIGVRVWRNMSTLNQTRQGLSLEQRRKGAIMIGFVVGSCIIFFAMRLVVFGLKPDFMIASDKEDTFQFTTYLFGYWLAEIPATIVMLYVMRRSYKSTPLLDDTMYKNIMKPSRVSSAPSLQMSKSGDDFQTLASSLKHAFSNVDNAHLLKGDPNASDDGSGGGHAPKWRVEFAVSCTFPVARKAVIAVIPPCSEHDRGTLVTKLEDRAIDRTEAMIKGSMYHQFRRTLLYTGEPDSEVVFVVFDNRSDSNDKQTWVYAGEASFKLHEIQHSPNHRTIRDIYSIDKSGNIVENNGAITVQIIMEEPHVHKENVVTKSYLFPVNDSHLHVREELHESPYAFQCAYQMLKLLIPMRHREMQELQKRQNQLGNHAVSRSSTTLPNPAADLFGCLVVGIMEGNEENSTVQWFTNLLQRYKEHFDYSRSALLFCKARQDKRTHLGLSFKPSTSKSDAQLGFIATNLHQQELQILNNKTPAGLDHLEAVYETVTFGAPAAHVFKFKHGLRALQARWLKAMQFLKSNSLDPHQTATLLREVETLKLEIRQRHDVVICQAVAALVSSFVHRVENACKHYYKYNYLSGGQAFLEIVEEVGFLFQVESLLSTNGAEIGMLEDMAVAVRDLAYFCFVLAEDPAERDETKVRFERWDGGGGGGGGGAQTSDNTDVDSWIPPFENGPVFVKITVYLKPSHFEKLPERLREGLPIRVFPVLFTQGINEQQTIANTVGDSTLQEEINKENLRQFQAYIKGYRLYLQKIGAVKEVEDIEATFAQIERLILISRREKNIHILAKSSDLTRKMMGGRATCCKSAKDRTSMAITWEQARLLERHHQLPGNELVETMHVMRSAGVRRENAFKNIGVDKYAFNQFQMLLIPDIYKPPKGTEGARVT